jgi:hypothetical protein
MNPASINRFSVISGAALVLVAGCAAPLETNADRDALAQAANVPASQVQFFSYCSFGETPPSGHHVRVTEGVILLTHDSLLITELPPSRAVKQKIAYREMTGVDVVHFGFGRELQVKLPDGNILVLQVSRDRGTVDKVGTEKVQQILLARGVASWHSDTFYLGVVDIPPISLPIIKH